MTSDINFQEYCAPGACFEDTVIQVNPNVELRLITFTPPGNPNTKPVLFVPGWISLMVGWQITLLELTKDHKVYYLETREKISSVVTGPETYAVSDLSQDLAETVRILNLKDNNFILFGSSLGGTVILDSIGKLPQKPSALALVGPNAVFRVPLWGKILVHLFYPGFYRILKQFVKWYLKNFRLDPASDIAQYKKYCRALDIADPWKLKAAVIPFSKYQVWPLLPAMDIPTLIIGASKDVMHEPENLEKMTEILPNAQLLDMETNTGTHSREMVHHLRKFLNSLNDSILSN